MEPIPGCPHDILTDIKCWQIGGIDEITHCGKCEKKKGKGTECTYPVKFFF